MMGRCSALESTSIMGSQQVLGGFASPNVRDRLGDSGEECLIKRCGPRRNTFLFQHGAQIHDLGTQWTTWSGWRSEAGQFY